jgi:hypothetical protein
VSSNDNLKHQFNLVGYDPTKNMGRLEQECTIHLTIEDNSKLKGNYTFSDTCKNSFIPQYIILTLDLYKQVQVIVLWFNSIDY